MAPWQAQGASGAGENLASCVGLATQLTGGPLDGLKQRVARWVIAQRFGDDARWREGHDSCIAAIVAEVPTAADFDMDSLRTTRMPLGLVNAQQDRRQAPRFLGLRVLQACSTCEALAAAGSGGHGMGLDPLRPMGDGLLKTLPATRPASTASARNRRCRPRWSTSSNRHLRQP